MWAPASRAARAGSKWVPAGVHTWFMPQLTPPILLAASTQACAPVEHDVVPSLHAFGLVMQATPAVHAWTSPGRASRSMSASDVYGMAPASAASSRAAVSCVSQTATTT